jgi:hypothetical protein
MYVRKDQYKEEKKHTLEYMCNEENELNKQPD